MALLHIDIKIHIDSRSSMSIFEYIHNNTYITNRLTCMYIYIYIERERERRIHKWYANGISLLLLLLSLWCLII